MRYLGIDYGDSHIGLALGEDETRLAMPLETLPNKGLDAFCDDIRRISERENVGTVVVGVPSLGSAFDAQRKKIEDVIVRLQTRLTLPIIPADESFTSREAQHLLRESGGAPDTDEHAVAAMLILQAYLDTHSR